MPVRVFIILFVCNTFGWRGKNISVKSLFVFLEVPFSSVTYKGGVGTLADSFAFFERERENYYTFLFLHNPPLHRLY